MIHTLEIQNHSQLLRDQNIISRKKKVSNWIKKVYTPYIYRSLQFIGVSISVMVHSFPLHIQCQIKPPDICSEHFMLSHIRDAQSYSVQSDKK